MILALDLGTKTGWALRRDDGQYESGVVNFKGSRFQGGGMRFLRFRQWLDELSPKPREVYFEAVRGGHKGIDASHIYGGLLATLTAWCEEHDIPYDGYSVQSIKKHAVGRGNASKAEMMAAFKRFWGSMPETDDQADAFWLLQLVLTEKNMNIFE